MSDSPNAPADVSGSAGGPSIRSEIYPAREYHPDGGFDVPGLAMLTAGMVVAGGVLGYLAHFVSAYLWLIVAFPILFGTALGFVASYAIKKGRLRNPPIAGVVSFIGALLMMTMMHEFNYETFKTERAAENPDYVQYQNLTPQQRNELLDEAEQNANHGSFQRGRAREKAGEYLDYAAVNSFGSYMNWEAAQGITIKRGSDDKASAPTFSGVGAWIYWAVEVLIAAGMAFAIGRSAAKMPYSRSAEVWKTARFLGTFQPRKVKTVNEKGETVYAISNASAAAASTSAISQALRSGNLTALTAAGPTPGMGPILLTAYHLPGDAEDDIDLKLEAVGAKNARKQLAMVTWPPAALPALMALFSPSTQSEPQPQTDTRNAPGPVNSSIDASFEPSAHAGDGADEWVDATDPADPADDAETEAELPTDDPHEDAYRSDKLR